MRALVAKRLEKCLLNNFVGHLRDDHRVFGPIARKYDVSFQEAFSPDALDLGYTSTTLPPKRFFHHREAMMTFDGQGDCAIPELESEQPILLLGVHSCDLNAILRQDKLFSRDFVDPYYKRRREKSSIMALTCTEIGENCFCTSLGTGPTIKDGFDLLLTDLGETYLLEVGTQRGLAMVRKLSLPDASPSDFEEKDKRVNLAISKFKKRIAMQGLNDLVSNKFEDEVWTLIGESGGLAGCHACLSCGNCSLVCPTCYCYEVSDALDMSLRTGTRTRELDSCQLLEYAKVALGGNFRADRKSRTRHWMLCKFGAAAGQVNSSCVGCGRCIHSCPAHIDLTEVARSLWGE